MFRLGTRPGDRDLLNDVLTTWLESETYRVYKMVKLPLVREHSHGKRVIDIVGRKAGAEDVAIITGRWFDPMIIRWAGLAQLGTNRVYCAVLTHPMKRSIENCRARGIGVIKVRFGEMTVVIEPMSNRKVLDEYRFKLE